jgi:hypothetical protein
MFLWCVSVIDIRCLKKFDNVRVMQPENRIEGRCLWVTHLSSTTGQAMDCVMDVFQATPGLGICRSSTGGRSKFVVAHRTISFVSLKDIRNTLCEISLWVERTGRQLLAWVLVELLKHLL